MVQINWTVQAMGDLKSIADYISRDSIAYAKHQITTIKTRTQILKKHTEIGRVVPETNKNKIRELIEGKYRIIYKVVSTKQIDILTIHHSSKDFITNFS